MQVKRNNIQQGYSYLERYSTTMIASPLQNESALRTMQHERVPSKPKAQRTTRCMIWQYDSRVRLAVLVSQFCTSVCTSLFYTVPGRILRRHHYLGIQGIPEVHQGHSICFSHGQGIRASTATQETIGRRGSVSYITAV